MHLLSNLNGRQDKVLGLSNYCARKLHIMLRKVIYT